MSNETIPERAHNPCYPDGTPIKIGDRVEITTDLTSSRVAGAQATITCYWSSGNEIGLQFDTEDISGSNLNSFLPSVAGRENRFGQYAPTRSLKLAKPVFIDESEEGLLKTLTEAVSTSPAVATINGKFYNLSPVENPAANAALKPILDSMVKKLSEIRTASKREVDQVKAAAARSLVMPDINERHVRQGLQVYKEGGILVYVVPFIYAPKKLIKPDEEDEREIANPEEFQHNCLVKIGTNPATGGIQFIQTLDAKTYDFFPHYHSGGGSSDCLGTWKPPMVKTPADAFIFRDGYQKLLEVINGRSLMNDHPRGLPDIEDIETKTSPGTITKGSKVQVIAGCDGLPNELVGLVASVYTVGTTLASLDCLGQARYFAVPLTNLRLMPPETRRTRTAIPIPTQENLVLAVGSHVRIVDAAGAGVPIRYNAQIGTVEDAHSPIIRVRMSDGQVWSFWAEHYELVPSLVPSPTPVLTAPVGWRV